MTAKTLLLTRTRLSGGVWEGILTGAGDTQPSIEAVLDGAVIAVAEASRLPKAAGQWAVQIALPASVLDDGVQTVLLQSAGEVLAKVTIFAGAVPDDDIRAEVTLLRAELDLLKRAFQRQSRG